MSKQAEQKRERSRTKRDLRVVAALEYGISDALESDGVEMLGLAFKGDSYSCLMTLKGAIAGQVSICFVGSDSITNCILKGYSDARNDRLHWGPCKYHK